MCVHFSVVHIFNLQLVVFRIVFVVSISLWLWLRPQKKNVHQTYFSHATNTMCSIDFATFFLEPKKEKDIIICWMIFLKKFNAYQMIRQYSSENSKKISSTWLVYLLVIYQRIFTLFRLLKNHEIRPSLHDDRIMALLTYGFLIPTPYNVK